MITHLVVPTGHIPYRAPVDFEFAPNRINMGAERRLEQSHKRHARCHWDRNISRSTTRSDAAMGEYFRIHMEFTKMEAIRYAVLQMEPMTLTDCTLQYLRELDLAS